MTAPALVSAGEKLALLAARRPDQCAVTCARLDGEVESLTWSELDASTNRLARRLRELGVDESSFVAIGFPNGLEHFVAAWAIWKLGACAMPVGSSFPQAERDRLLGLGKPRVVLADWDDLETLTRADLAALDAYDGGSLERYPAPAPFKALGSGGSTGAPKLIVSPAPFACEGGVHPLGGLIGLDEGRTHFAPGPLYHNQAFFCSALALYQGARAVTAERFREDLVLDVIAREGVDYLNVVPTMMGRLLRAPEIERADLAGLQTLLHMAAPCPDWVKRGWIEHIGAEKVVEIWAATELTGVTLIRGDEWLTHPGSVGKPIASEVKILGPDGEELGPGEVGEIYSKLVGGPGYAYLGAEPLPEVEGGFRSVGDMGRLDEEGYLYLADRCGDLILTGGSNVFPAEVEGALSSHPDVADVVVVGLEDPDLGRRVHAIVQPTDSANPPDEAALDAHARERLARYKVPRSYAFTDALPRTETGKIRRGDLRSGEPYS